MSVGGRDPVAHQEATHQQLGVPKQSLTIPFGSHYPSQQRPDTSQAAFHKPDMEEPGRTNADDELMDLGVDLASLPADVAMLFIDNPGSKKKWRSIVGRRGSIHSSQ